MNLLVWSHAMPEWDPVPPWGLQSAQPEMLRSDSKDLTIETLEKQYELVRKRTSNNFTYNQGSHVMQFGDLIIDEEPVADYLGDLNTGTLPPIPAAPQWWRSALQCIRSSMPARRRDIDATLPSCVEPKPETYLALIAAGGFSNDALTAGFSQGGQESINQRDADLLHLWTVFQRAAPGAPKADALAALTAETTKRAKTDADVRAAVAGLLQQPAVLLALQVASCSAIDAARHPQAVC